MRLIPILLGLALASAGCFGSDEETPDGDDGTGTPTPTTPETTTTPPVTTTPPAGGENDTDGDGGTPPPPPQELHNASVSFANPPSPVGAPPSSVAVTVPAGYATAYLNVTFAPSSSAPGAVAQGISVTFTDSAGTPLTCTLANNAMTEAETCSQTGAIAPGAGEISFTGEGTVDARVVLVVTA